MAAQPGWYLQAKVVMAETGQEDIQDLLSLALCRYPMRKRKCTEEFTV